MRRIGESARPPVSRDKRVLSDGNRRIPGHKGPRKPGVHPEAQLQLPHLA